MIDALPTAVLMVRADGTIALANPRAAELLERPREVLEGAHVGDVLVPRADLDEARGRSRSTARIALPSGREIDVGLAVSDLEVDHPGCLVCAFQDITPTLRLQEERDRLMKLATVGEVLPSILHELRNPLSAVTTALELLVEDHAGGALGAELHGILGEIRRALLCLDGIGVVGRDVRSSSLGAIDHAVRECCVVLDARAARSGIVLEVDIASMPLLRIDRGVVRAVVFNLLMNALHACREGDRVRVIARLERDELVIGVRDQGPGMSPEVLARCTEIFFTTKRSGSGLGLPLCVQLARSAGGSLHVESALGRGTHVTWRVPVGLDAEDGGEVERWSK
ncbi:two-component system sensor histidine kinase NtrB [Sandaracinus amylolyticus]|uniref:two-component system sensor histidine kinase NtrB n=1 Tax=Sandaracinus amylolyticus TaxID=927083 RepID=UPI001F184D41|nr:ATP-binding protein [Sandaracinus amylolyticus]